MKHGLNIIFSGGKDPRDTVFTNNENQQTGRKGKTIPQCQ